MNTRLDEAVQPPKSSFKVVQLHRWLMQIRRLVTSNGLTFWDTFLLMNGDQIYWFSIINSLMIMLSFISMVGIIMMRSLYGDITKYVSWRPKLGGNLSMTMFPAHINSGLLCVYVGIGVQTFGRTIVTDFFPLSTDEA